MKITKKQSEIIKILETLLSEEILKDCSATKRSFFNYEVNFKNLEELSLKASKIDSLVKQYKICKGAEINGCTGIAIRL